MSRGFMYSGIVPGIANQFGASISAGVVTINTGAVWVDGFYGETTINHTVSSAGLGPGLIVLRADPVARTIGFVYLPGVTTPNQPSNGQGQYEIPLYYVTSATAFTDVRQWATATDDFTRYNFSYPYLYRPSNSNYCARGKMWRYAAYSSSTTLYNYGWDTVWYGEWWQPGGVFYCPYSADYFVSFSLGYVGPVQNAWVNGRVMRNSDTTNCWAQGVSAAAGGWAVATTSDVVPARGGDVLYVQHWYSHSGYQGLTNMADVARFTVRALQ
jgi:hypothetical protein